MKYTFEIEDSKTVSVTSGSRLIYNMKFPIRKLVKDSDYIPFFINECYRDILKQFRENYPEAFL